MLVVQKYLRKHSVDALFKNFAITANRHKDYPNLISFSYSLINSPMELQIVQECRGLILDEANDWAIVAYPYKKFFNYGEKNAVKLDWTSTVCLEKLDGSIAILYYYDNKWHVGSSGTPDGNGVIWQFDKDGNFLKDGETFHEMFFELWDELNYEFPTDTKVTHIFEFISQKNRIICRYPEDKIVFHGARNIETLQELPYTYGEQYNWEIVKAHPLQTLEEIVEICKTLKPLENEGFVVVDKYFNRQKIKSPQYVALSHMKTGMGLKRILKIILNHESDEFLAYFPEFEKPFKAVKKQYDKYVADVNAKYNEVKHITSQKEFAATIKNLVPFYDAMFLMRKFGISCEDYLKEERRFKRILEIFKKDMTKIIDKLPMLKN